MDYKKLVSMMNMLLVYDFNFVTVANTEDGFVFRKNLNRSGYDLYIQNSGKEFRFLIKIVDDVVYTSKMFDGKQMWLEIKNIIRFAETFLEYYCK